MQVRVRNLARGRHPQRPGTLLRLEENPLLALAGRHPALGVGRRAQFGNRRDDLGARRRSAQVQGPKSKDVMVASLRRDHHWTFPTLSGLRHRQDVIVSPERLHREAQVRSTSERDADGVKLWDAVLAAGRNRRASSGRATSSGSRRGSRARLRHVVRHESVRGRDGLRVDGRPRAGGRLHRQGS